MTTEEITPLLQALEVAHRKNTKQNSITLIATGLVLVILGVGFGSYGLTCGCGATRCFNFFVSLTVISGCLGIGLIIPGSAKLCKILSIERVAFRALDPEAQTP